MSLKSAAEAHVQSYAKVFSKTSPAPVLAQEMTSLYRYPFVSFVFGKPHIAPSQDQMIKGSTPYLEKWLEHGLLRFKLAKSRIEELSPTNAFCWLTWELDDDKDGKKGWSWENVYVFRKVEDGNGGDGSGGGGGFEATFADNEILGLMQHAPEILQGLPGLS